MEGYKSFRERYGEHVGPDSPVIWDKFNTDIPLGAKYPRRISEQTIYDILVQLAERAGIMQRVHLTEGPRPGKVRHDVKAVHGLRKGFDTQCTNAGISPLWVEFFEGRQLMRSKGRYYGPTDQQLLEGIHETNKRGYVHAIDSLTINEENRLKKQVEELTIKKDELEALKNKVEHMDQIYGVSKKFYDQFPRLADMKSSLKLLKVLTDVSKSEIGPEEMYDWLKPAINKIENARKRQDSGSQPA